MRVIKKKKTINNNETITTHVESDELPTEINIIKTFPTVPDEYNLFFDMDGVAVEYDETFYKPTDKEGRPTLHAPINQFGAHIFLSTIPCDNIINTIKRLYDLEPDCKFNVHILTGVNPTIVMTEHVLDKFLTITDMLPEFERNHIHIAPSGLKTDYIEKLLHRPINEKDLLIDDYPKNLRKWQSKGGTAVKALNDYNHNHNDFDWIDTRDDHVDIINKLFYIMQNINNKEKGAAL